MGNCYAGSNVFSKGGIVKVICLSNVKNTARNLCVFHHVEL